MEITEKFNLKSKALIIILITLLITGISTMSYAAMPRFPNLGEGKILEAFNGMFGNMLERAKTVYDNLNKYSDIDIQDGKLLITIKDAENAEEAKINLGAVLAKAEEGLGLGVDVSTFDLKVGEGEKAITLVAMKEASGSISLDLAEGLGVVVNADVSEGIELIDGKVKISGDAVAGAKIQPNDDGSVTLIAATGGSVTINAMDKDLVTLSGTEEGNNAIVTVNIPEKTVTADVNAQQTVAVEGLGEKTFEENVNLNEETNLSVDVKMDGTSLIGGPKGVNLRNLFNTIMQKLSGLRAGFGAMFNR